MGPPVGQLDALVALLWDAVPFLVVFGLGAACWYAFDALAALCESYTGSADR